MKKLLLIALLIGFAFKSNAQEVQVPLDLEGKILIVDERLEEKIKLFQEYLGFKEARLFITEDSSYVLEVLYEMNRQQLKERKNLTDQELIKFRRRVSDAISMHAPESVLDQSGKTRLMINTALVSLFYYGVSTPRILNVEAENPAAGLTLITAGAGFYAALELTKNAQITKADAALSSYGLTRGIGQGIALVYLFDEDPGNNTVLGIGMLGSIGSGFGGYYWAENTKMSEGTASTIRALGDFGVGISFGIANSLGMLNDPSNSTVAGTALLGNGVGMFTGALLNNNEFYTKGDAIMFRGAGILGAAIGILPYTYRNDVDGQTLTGAATLGTLLGFAVGHNLAKRNEFTTNEGIMIVVSEIAGASIGAGLGYLISDDDFGITYTSTVIGMVAGFALMKGKYQKKTSRIRKNAHSFNLMFDPSSALGLIDSDLSLSPNNVTSPLIHASWKF